MMKKFTRLTLMFTNKKEIINDLFYCLGVCCYYLNKARRDRHLPKFHGGMYVLVNEKRTEVTAERVKSVHSIVEYVLFFVSVLIAPVALYGELSVIFNRKKTMDKLTKYKNICDEFSKIHGIVF